MVFRFALFFCFVFVEQSNGDFDSLNAMAKTKGNIFSRPTTTYILFVFHRFVIIVTYSTW